MQICRVVPDVPAIEREFDYLVPAELAGLIRVGTIVRVLLHGRRVRAWVTATDVKSAVVATRIKPIAGLSSAGPPADVVELCVWTARRFVGSVVAVLRAASPCNNVPVSPQQGLTKLVVGQMPSGQTEKIGSDLRPLVWWPALDDRRAQVVSMLSEDGSSIVLVADTARADALVSSLCRLGWPAIAWHSDLSRALRTDSWKRSLEGGCIVIGGRTAVFAPVPDLRACVVVDDLDEALQEERQPTWHAREVLAERARRVGAQFSVISPLPSVVALASATSVVERSRDLQLAGWPRIDVVDLGEQAPNARLLSEPLVVALRGAVASGRPALCLVNRRGRARLMYCTSCREVSRWDRDESPADPEKAAEVVALGLRPTVCIHCGAPKPRLLRSGVDRIATDIAALLGNSVNVCAVDADADNPDSAADIVVGTETLLYRHELRRRNPALVALLDFDQELFAPRIRANEQALWLATRCAQLLAGQPRSQTQLIIQTHVPNHGVLRAILECDLASAQRIDAEERSAFGLAPYGAQALLTGDGEAVDAAIAGLRLVLGDSVVIKGPSGADNKRRALVEHQDVEVLASAFADIVGSARLVGRVRVEMDPSRA